ncbi:hypothetical protein Pcinc_015753 [Petrolisthes cinctipes]|uniref:Ig-like domain-containing protein n=1 Tax=Petrolisthes cinctipes TaxID=88211 RepID=A0AAE1FSD8_PETCI|nr:hypothetical protein Pcinc_015753 [Petrolisthes cinctipes]
MVGRSTFDTSVNPARLQLDPVASSDQGLYTCRVDFLATSTQNTVVNLTVIDISSSGGGGGGGGGGGSYGEVIGMMVWFDGGGGIVMEDVIGMVVVVVVVKVYRLDPLAFYRNL